MRKQALGILLIALSNWMYSQEVITNTITENHENISGTKVSFIPPSGFSKTTDFSGFEDKESRSMILVMEMPGSNSMLKEALSTEALLSQGVELEAIREFTINGVSGILITGQEHPDRSFLLRTMLILSPDDEIILIDCAYPDDQPEIGDQIVESLLTLVHSSDIELNPLDELDFIVDSDSAELDLAMAVANMAVYTPDRKFPSESEDATTLMIFKDNSEVSIDDQKSYALAHLEKSQSPFKIEEIQSTEPIMVDGISGYEICAKATPKPFGEQHRLYVVVLFSDDARYIFFGSTTSDDPQTLDDVKGVVQSFKRK